MSRYDNFKGNIHKLTAEEQSEAGKKSAESRRRKRDLRKALESLLEKDFQDTSGASYSGAEVLAIKLFEKAKKGDVRAFEILRDTAGQKPIERVAIAEVDQAVIDEVEAMVNGYDETEGN